MQIKQAGVVIKRRRRSITFTRYTAGAETPAQKSSRTKIVGWNDGMARRLGNYIENFRQDFSVMGTLTYPAAYPCNGDEVKAHWRAFVERLRRTGWMDKGGSLVWFLEFQDRGAPHFHFLATNFVGKEWVAKAWAEITNGDASSCSRMETLRWADSAGAYARKYAMKSEQKTVPPGFERIGRMWGCVGNKIVRGMPRQPVVVAATIGPMPTGFDAMLMHCIAAYKVRVAWTMSGMVIYGTTEGIESSWRYLRVGSAIHVLTDNFRASTQPGTAGA